MTRTNELGALTLPASHSTGTSRQSLIAEYEAARHAVHTAINAVAEACPNARDYYRQGSDAFTLAAMQHIARLESLSRIESELAAILTTLLD